MRTIETRVYRYEELDGFAQRKALAHFSDINLDADWWQPTYETWSDMCVRIKSFDLYKKHIELDYWGGDFIDVASSIVTFMGKDHEGYKFAQDYLDATDNLTEDEREDADALFYSDLKECILDWLEGEWQYLQSEEAVEQTIIDHEIEFTKEGRVFDYE